jgi:hypothetical protein
MRRVVGAGKARRAPAKKDIEISELVEEASSSDGEDADAKEEGRKFARHLMEAQGADFLKKFHEGLMEFCEENMELERGRGVLRIEHGVEGGRIVPPGKCMTGGRVIPPGGISAKAYGNPPQAPASFERNGVMLDVAAEQSAPVRRGRGKRDDGAVSQTVSPRGLSGKAMPGTGPGAVPLPLAEPPTIPIMRGGKRSDRANMVSFLMKQKGMSLGEASKHIKAKGATSLSDLK